MKRMKTVLSLALLSASMAIGYQVYAHCGHCAEDGKKIAAQLDKNKFTLAKAVTAAEAHSQGRSISVISDLSDKGEAGVHVYCMKADKIVMCDVDPTTGSIKDMKDVEEFPTLPKTHAHDEGHDHPAPGGGAGGAGGGREPVVLMINSREVEAGCGKCIYKMSGVDSCQLAAVIDGKPYRVEGAKWPNHDCCSAKQQAVVTGKLQGDTLIITKLEPKS